MEILIANNYFIYDNSHTDQFHIAIYYITDNKCKIKIRRLDDIGWGQDLKIQIDNEKISLGSSEENFKMLEFYTNTLLIRSEYLEQIIPKVIIQTSNYKMNESIYHYNSIMSFIELNPEYSYKFFTDTECRTFIKNNHTDEILTKYDLLIHGNTKAQFFSYCYLYICGGCYFNCKIIDKVPLNKIIKKDDKLLISNDNKSIILSEKNNETIYKYIINYNNLPTNQITSLIKKDNHIYLLSEQNKPLFKSEYNNYKSNDRSDKYLYDEYGYAHIGLQINNLYKDFKFYFYPNDHNDTFNIIMLKDNIFIIKRTDIDSGWGQAIKLKVINTKTDIGNSYNNEKVFII